MYDETFVNPLGLAVLVVLCLMLLVVKREHTVLPFIIMSCFIAPGQRIAVAGLDFNFLRILILFGCLRLAFRQKEIEGFDLIKLDKLLIWWSVAMTVAYTILHGSFPAFINRLGSAFDAVGIYFLFRIWLKRKEDIEYIAKVFIVVSIPVLFFFLIEKSTGRNMFSVFGGVPEFTEIREGKLRCQGAFAHPILAGCFWAVLLPFYFSIYSYNLKNKVFVCVGIITSFFLVVLSASSTPVLSVAFGIIGVFALSIRYYLNVVRLLILFSVIFLHIIMKAPVWHLISRIDVAGGSTGYHRFHLIDQWINRWPEWFLIGVVDTSHWGWGLGDVTNEYVLVAVRGGIVGLLLFIFIIVTGFRYIGKIWRFYESINDRESMLLYWMLGVSLFMHVTNFIAVSYFGQIYFLWYLTFALVSNGYIEAQKRKAMLPQKQLTD